MQMMISEQDARIASRELRFGPFRLDPQQRIIRCSGTPLRLGGRAREILLTLVERAGKTVNKSELMARVWPDTVVEEGTLRVHIAALRKALGDGQFGMRYVENVTGHGYRFIAPVTEVSGEEHRPGIPRPLNQLIGLDASAELQLNLALGDTILDTIGPHPDGTAAFNRALELSERVGSTMHRGRALSGLCAVRIGTGDYQSAVGFAESLRLIAEDYRDDSASFAPDWLISLAHHLAGDQVLARHHIERALMRPARRIASSCDRPFQFDLAVAAHAVQARVLWIQGFPDQAARAARQSLMRAEGTAHSSSICYALSVCCAIALYTGDASEAQRLIARLLEHSLRHSLSYWSFWGRCLQVALARQHGDKTVVHPGVSDPLYSRLHQETLATLHPELATEEAFLRAENGFAAWCAPELLRVKAEILLRQSCANAVAAEASLQRSIDTARRQGALAWELRTATSLARIWSQQGRACEARELLMSVYAKFTEGFETMDLIKARTLLE